MALCFLPAQHILPLFERLCEEATTDKLRELVEYMRGQWMEHSVWDPSSWSVYGLSIRTNNDCEGWHNRVNKKGRPNMPLYMPIELLFEEASFLPTQLKLVSDAKLKRHQRQVYQKIQQKIFTYWDEYASGDRSAFQLLRACSRVYAPMVNYEKGK